MKKLISFIVILALMAPVCLAHTVYGYDFLLVLDDSGSMSGAPLNALKQAAENVINDLNAQNGDINIGFIDFNTYANLIQDFQPLAYTGGSLLSRINAMRANGGTYTDRALDLARTTAQRYISGNSGRRVSVIVMSDGYPEGPSLDGVYNSADKLKYMNPSAVRVYSVGFFHSMDGYLRKQCEDVMRYIASDNTGFYIVDDVSKFGLIFADIFDVIIDADKIVIWLEGPAEASISYGGEVLSSTNPRTSFGSMQFEGGNSERKVLRLEDKSDYKLQIQGTGTGYIDYTIRYPDGSGSYSDTRKIVGIPASTETRAYTYTVRSDTTEVYDLSSDIIYRAPAGQKVVYTDHSLPISACVSGLAATASSYYTENTPAVAPSRMLDGDRVSSWDAWGEHEGAWVRISATDGCEYRISGMRIINGKGIVPGDEEWYFRNSRVQTCSVYVDDMYMGSYTLQDHGNPQIISFPETVTGSSVYMTIDSVYRGTRYDNPNYGVCISEISLF